MDDVGVLMDCLDWVVTLVHIKRNVGSMMLTYRRNGPTFSRSVGRTVGVLSVLPLRLGDKDVDAQSLCFIPVLVSHCFPQSIILELCFGKLLR